MQALMGSSSAGTIVGTPARKFRAPDVRGPLVAGVVAAMITSVATIVPTLVNGPADVQPAATSAAVAATTAATAGVVVPEGAVPAGLSAAEWTSIREEIANARAVDAVPAMVAATSASGTATTSTTSAAMAVFADAPRLEAAAVAGRFAAGSVAVASAPGASDVVFTTSRVGTIAATQPPATTVEVGIEFAHAPGVTEWFRAMPDGLQQGFTIDEPVSVSGAFEIVVGIENGVPVLVDPQTVSIARTGQTGLVYRDLFAWDANGRELAASMSVDGSDIVLSVDATGAVYPITVDPTITEDQKLTPPNYQAEFGERVDIDDQLIVVSDPDDQENGFGTGAVSVFRDNVLEAKLLGPVAGAEFGWDVAVEDNATHELILVGAPLDDTNGVDAGVVYAYLNTGAGWSAPVALYECAPEGCDPSAAPSGGGALQQFGYAVDIADEGSALLAVIGAPRPSVANGGEVTVARYDVGLGTWETDSLLAARSGGPIGEMFGASVAISPNATRIGIGSPRRVGSFGAGSAAWFDNIGGGGFGLRSITAGTTPGYGSEIDLDDVRSVVGAPAIVRHLDYGGTGGFTPYDLTTIASPVAKSGSSGSPRYGSSLSIDADHIQFGLIGSFGPSNPTHGGIRYYQWNGTDFVSLGHINDSGFRLGWSLAADGGRTVAGQPLWGSDGRANSYDSNFGAVPAVMDPTPGNGSGPVADRTGHAVAINGNVMAVSAPFADVGNSGAGVVYMYERDSTTGPWVLMATISSPDPETDGGFGDTVALFGDRLAIGESDRLGDQAEHGRVFVFERSFPGTWAQVGTPISSQTVSYDAFGASAAWLDSDTLIVGAPGANGSAGVVYEVTYGVADWNAPTPISTPSVDPGDELGFSVAVDQDRAGNWIIAAGAPGDDGAIDTTADSGALRIYRDAAPAGGASHVQSVHIGAGWEAGDRMGTAVASDNGYLAVAGMADGTASADLQAYLLEDLGFGYSIVGEFNDILPVTVTGTPNAYLALEGRNLFLGRPGNGGQVGVFRDVDGGGFPAAPTDTFQPTGLLVGDALGFGVSVEERSIAVGAPGDQSDAGAVYSQNSLSLSHTYIGADGDWTDATNWDTGRVPGSNETAVIPAGSFIDVTTAVEIGSLVVAPGGQVSVFSGGQLTLYSAPGDTPDGVPSKIGGDLRVLSGGVLEVPDDVTFTGGTITNFNGGTVDLFPSDEDLSVSGNGSWSNAGTLNHVGGFTSFVGSGINWTSPATGQIVVQFGDLDMGVTTYPENGTITVAPGAGIRFAGNISLESTGVIEIEIDGPSATPGTYGVLEGAGSPSFGGGTLNATLVGGYTPTGADSYPVIVCGACEAFGTTNVAPFEATVGAATITLALASSCDTEWTNGSGDDQWSNPANWTAGVPGSTSITCMDVPGVTPVTVSGTHTIRRFETAREDLIITGDLTINEGSVIDGAVQIDGGLEGGGEVVLNGGGIMSSGFASNQIRGDVTIPAATDFEIAGGRFTAANFVNDGNVKVSSPLTNLIGASMIENRGSWVFVGPTDNFVQGIPPLNVFASTTVVRKEGTGDLGFNTPDLLVRIDAGGGFDIDGGRFVVNSPSAWTGPNTIRLATGTEGMLFGDVTASGEITGVPEATSPGKLRVIGDLTSVGGTRWDFPADPLDPGAGIDYMLDLEGVLVSGDAFEVAGALRVAPSGSAMVFAAETTFLPGSEISVEHNFTNPADITNQGSVVARAEQFGGGGGSFTNDGAVEFTRSFQTTMSINAPWTSTVGSFVEVVQGTVVDVQQPVSIEGTLKAQPSTLLALSNFTTLGADSVIEVEISGSSSTSANYGRVNFDNPPTLTPGATLRSTLSGYTPTDSDSYPVITCFGAGVCDEWPVADISPFTQAAVGNNIVLEPEPVPANKILSDNGGRDRFGVAVDVDGNTAVIAELDQPGEISSLWIGRRSTPESPWTLIQQLSPGVLSSGVVDVAIRDGVIAALADNGNVAIFEETGPVLAPFALAATSAGLAQMRSIDTDGAGVFAAGPLGGTLWTKAVGGGWQPENSVGAPPPDFGADVAIDGQVIAVSANDPDVVTDGTVYVYERIGDLWTGPSDTLTAPLGSTNDGYFGSALAVDGSTLVIGQQLEDNDAGDPRGVQGDAGAVWVYSGAPGAWSAPVRLVPGDSDTSNQFGSAVSVDGPTIVIGAEAAEEQGVPTRNGAAYVYRQTTGGLWVEAETIRAIDGAGGDLFGAGVSVSGSAVIVGAPQDDNANGIDAGAVYVYDLIVPDDPTLSFDLTLQDPANPPIVANGAGIPISTISGATPLVERKAGSSGGVGSTALDATGVAESALAGTKLGETPFGAIAVSNDELANLPILSIGLDLADELDFADKLDWPQILDTDEFRERPIVNITVGEVFDSEDPILQATLDAIPFGAIDVGGTPFGAIPFGAIALGDVPLTQIPPGPDLTTPAQIESAWCDILAGTSEACNGGVLDSNSTLLSISLSDVPFGAIPFGAIPFGAIPVADAPFGAINLDAVKIEDTPFGAIPFGAIPFGAIDINQSPFGAIPFGAIPFGAIPFGAIPFGAIDLGPAPFGAIPFGAIDVNGTPFGAIPFGAIAMGDIELASIPLDPDRITPAEIEADWCALMADYDLDCTNGATTVADTTITDLGVRGVPFGAIPFGAIPYGAIPFGAIPFGAIPLKDVPFGAINLNAVDINAVDLDGTPFGAIPFGAIPFGAISTSVGAIPFGAIDVQGSPFGAIRLEDIDTNATPFGAIPFGAIPFGAISPDSVPFGAIPFGAIPFGAINGNIDATPFGAIDLVDSPFGAIPFGAIPFGAIGDIVDCTKIACDSNATLRDAFLVGAIQPGATLEDLGGAADGFRLPDLAEHLLGIDAQLLYDAVATWGANLTLADLAGFGNMTLADLPVDNPLFRQTVLNDVRSGLSTVTFEDLALALLVSVTNPVAELDAVVDGFGANLTLADFNTFGDVPFSALLPGLGGSQLGELGSFLAFIHLGQLGLTDQEILAALSTGGTGLNGAFLVRDAVNDPDLNLGDMKLADITGTPDWGAATVLDLVNSLPADEVAGFTFSDLLLGMLPPGALPWGLAFEKIDAKAIPGVMPAITMQADFSLTGRRPRSVEVSVELPTNAAYLPGSTTVTPAIGGDLEPVEVDGRLVWTFTGVQPGPDVETPGPEYVMNFDVQPTLAIGSTAVNADSRIIGAPSSVASTALLQVLEAFEDNDIPADAITVEQDTVYLLHIPDEEDVDLFTVTLQENDALAVDLSGLPADFDVVLYRESTAPVSSTALSQTTGGDPLVPLLDPDSDGTETVPDQSFPRFDLGDSNLSMIELSNSRGRKKETIVTDRLPAGRYVIQVHGHDGANSPEPAVLQINIIEAGDVPECAVRGAFTGSATPGQPVVPANLPADLDTVILLNEMRFEQIYGAAGRSAVTTSLNDLVTAMNLDVEISTLGLSAVVVPVDGYASVRDAYAFWDNPAAYGGDAEDACNPGTANDIVSTIISDVLDPIRAVRDIENIVLVGSDDLLPFGRLSDATQVANEFDYRNDLQGRNAFTGSFWSSTFLSDDPYAETGALPYGDRFLYVPDATLGRVLESPDQIVAQIEQFIEFDGFLDADTGLIAGYDFLIDGSEAIADELRDGVPTIDDVLADGLNAVGDPWSAADFAAALLDNVPAGENGFDLVSFNAHFDHYRALPADGDGVTNFNKNFEASVISALATDDPRLDGTIIFSMGCHSGLNVPDLSVGLNGVTDDWAQVLTGQRAIYIGNTGFGYGDTETVGYTERLMQLFARNVASPIADDLSDPSTSTSIGDAMRYAKQEAFAELSDVSVYHEKAYQESTFYGLPFFRVGVAPELPAPLVDADVDIDDLTGSPAATFVADPLNDVNTVVTTTNGTTKTEKYFSNQNAQGDPVTITQPGRPIQPAITIDISDLDPADPTMLEREARGAIILDMTSTYQSIDPVLSRPVFDEATQAPEPKQTDIVFPTSPQRVSTLELPEGERQRLVLATGQYRGSETLGAQRLDDDIDVVVYYSGPNVADRSAPRILSVDTNLDGAELSITAHVDDGVGTGVDRVYVLVTGSPNEPSAEWVGVDLVDIGNDRWAGGITFASAPDAIELLAQAKDDVGNVGVSTNKALNFGDETVLPPPVTTLTATVVGAQQNGFYTGAVTVTASAGTSPVSYRLNSTGAFSPYPAGGVVVTGDRSHRIEFKSDDGQQTSRTFSIDTLPPTVTITKPAAQASYGVDQVVKSSFQCLDSSGATCTGVVRKNGTVVANLVSGQNLPTTPTGSYELTVTAIDPVGRTTTSVRSYTVIASPPEVISVTGPPTPQLITNGVDIGVEFDDADGAGDTYTVTVAFDDADPNDAQSVATTCTVSTTTPLVVGGPGEPSCELTQSPSGSDVGVVTSHFVYARPGVYNVTATVIDGGGQSHTLAVDQYVVVYDPGAGRVSGSGKFWSEDSSYVDADTDGEWAKFGYHAKYKTDDVVPDGKTKLDLKKEFKFTSVSYDYLIINDTMAVAEGLGEIDGVEGYRFRVQGIDNGSSDFFQITIWEDGDPENVVYDNGVIFDEDGNGDGDEVLTGGIKIKP